MEENPIIVFRHFDSSIEANIAKTKLDAHGIPCFLTEENMSNLYPGNKFLGFRVRLHLFEKDRELAEQILAEIKLSADRDVPTCPQCRSERIVRDFPAALKEQLLFVLFGIFLPHKKINHCLDCDSEF